MNAEEMRLVAQERIRETLKNIFFTSISDRFLHATIDIILIRFFIVFIC